MRAFSTEIEKEDAMSQVLCFARMSNQVKDNTGEGLRYLKTLFRQCTEGYIEIRPVLPEGDRQWIPVGDITVPITPEDKNIYVGVATRKYGKGSKKDIIEIPAVWVDLDFKDIKEEEAEKRLDEFKLGPSMIVRSGRGLHLYWILKNPATREDIERVEDINRRLVNHFGGDRASVEAAHLLRLPGTYNQRYNPPKPASLESTNDYLYDISDFDFLPPAESAAMTATLPSQSSGLTSTLLKGVHRGERHNTAVSLAGKFQKSHLSIEETKEILSQWNEKNDPPLRIEELNKDIDDIYNRYGQEKVSTINNNLTSVPDYMDYCTVIEKTAIGALDFMRKTLPERPSIIAPWLKNGEIGLISAPRGVGKTWLSLLIAMAATRKMEIGKWKTQTPTGCLYCDGEMAGDEMKNRLLELVKVCPTEEAPFIVLSADDMRSCDVPAPNLTNMDCRKGILDYLKKHADIRLLIIDNLACMTPGLDENGKRDWDQINQWLLQLRAIGTAVIMIHHTGKNGGQRGTSAREDILNFSMKLTNPVGYSPEDGAKFKIEFTKSRRLYGEDAKSFVLNLQMKGMKLTWTIEDDSENQKKDTIIEMLNKGDKQKDIAKELEVSESYVTQVKKKAKEEGKLKEEGEINKKRQLPDL